jgi:hypothetical protein
MSFNPEWCRDQEQRCEACPVGELQKIDPGTAEHTLMLLSMFEPSDVVRAVRDTLHHHDSYEFEMMVACTGDDIQTFYSTKSGDELAKEAILKIASAHNLNS